MAVVATPVNATSSLAGDLRFFMRDYFDMNPLNDVVEF